MRNFHILKAFQKEVNLKTKTVRDKKKFSKNRDRKLSKAKLKSLA
jgi:hypothetical protein